MCGLFGFVQLGAQSVSDDDIAAGREALHTLTHRGPDQWNDAIVGPCYMGHRRLSILDLSEAGRQPMLSANGQIALTVNGEIYNYKSVRDEIGRDQFKTESDSEVVLHGYTAWGMDRVIDSIDGMYAAVLWDQEKRQLHMVRDRIGVKPLLYAQIGGYFIWASELKAIKKFCDLKGFKLYEDPEALLDFLTYRYIPAHKTLYKQVKQLQPARHAVLSGEDLSVRQYWTLPTNEITASNDEMAERLRVLIAQSVEEQLMGDVPVGFFLSGGMDSSILVAEAARAHPQTPPMTFSIGYDHAAHDETHYAQMIADTYHAQHHVERLSGDLIDDLPRQIMDWYDQPFGDNSALPTYHVSKFARQHATVALSGDGGDELFGGYHWYRRLLKFQSFQNPLRPFAMGVQTALNRGRSGIVQKLLKRFDAWTHFDPLALHCLLIDGLPPSHTGKYREELGVAKDYDALWLFREYDRPDLPTRKRMQYIDFHTFLPDDILTKVDRVSMAVSLEARVPFLSKDLCEFAFSLPESFLYKNGELKGGLKYAYKDILPPEILDRGKKGFSIPLRQWNKAQSNLTFQEQIYLRCR